MNCITVVLILGLIGLVGEFILLLYIAEKFEKLYPLEMDIGQPSKNYNSSIMLILFILIFYLVIIICLETDFGTWNKYINEVFKTGSSISDLVYKSYIVEWVKILLKYTNELEGKLGEEAWISLGKIQWKEGRRWMKENISRLGIKGDDAESGAEIVRTGLQTFAPGLYTQKEFKILSKTPEKVLVELSYWCPILEASKKLKLDPEVPMKYIVKERLMGMLQTVNPKLDIEFKDISPNSPVFKILIEVKE